MIDMTGAPDDFYIGYEDRMPAATRQRVIAAVALFFVAAAAAGAGAVLGARPLPDSRFAFGVESRVTGVLRRDPYPSLDVDGRRVWLAGRGKFGADAVLRAVPDGRVTISGAWIERGRQRMLEVHDMGSGTMSVHAPTRTEVVPDPTSGPVTLHGEIVDSKCFLGVMNPGEGTVHRDCAARCLRGGMPPMLVVRDGTGREELVVLVSEDGAPAGSAIARLAGRPIRVTGRLVRDGDDYVLFARTYEPTN